MSEIQLLPKNRTNSNIYIIKAVELILSFGTINLLDPMSGLDKLVSIFGTIIKNRVHRLVFIKIAQERVVTGPDIQATCDLTPSSTYRALCEFERLGLIEPLTKSRSQRGRRGPKVTLYGLTGHWTPEDVLHAGFRLESLRVPGMALVINTTQMILDEYGSRGEVKFRDIQDKVRPVAQGHDVGSLSDLVARSVSQRGLKVWR